MSDASGLRRGVNPDRHLDSLELSTRTRNALRRYFHERGLPEEEWRVGWLAQLTTAQLLAIPEVGQVAIAELRRYMVIPDPGAAKLPKGGRPVIYARDCLLVDEQTAAAMLSVSRSTLRRWVGMGLVKRVRVPGGVRRNFYDTDALRDFVRSLDSEATS